MLVLIARVGHLDAALQDACRETRNALRCRVCMNGRERTAVAGVEELQQVESLAASNFA